MAPELSEDRIRKIVEEVVQRVVAGGAVTGVAGAEAQVGVFAEIDAAVAAATRAEQELVAQSLEQRQAIIEAIRQLSRDRAEDFARFETTLVDIPEIVECWAGGGGIDYMIKFVCKDLESYQLLVDGMLEAEIGLKRYYTYVVTKPVKDEPSPPLDGRSSL